MDHETISAFLLVGIVAAVAIGLGWIIAPQDEPRIPAEAKYNVMLRHCYDGAWPKDPLPDGCAAFLDHVSAIANEAEKDFIHE
jgi:hypothetical protein